MASYSRKVLIVGSGLSAYGACLALLEKENLIIDVIDIGLKKSYENQPNRPIPNAKHLSKSYYPYGINDKRWIGQLISKRMSSSHAYGGYSKVYSGSILRPSNLDLVDWPKESIPQEIDFQRILESLDLNVKKETLENSYPLNKRENKRRIHLGKSIIAFSYFDKKRKFRIPFDTSSKFDQWYLKNKINYESGQKVISIKENGKNLEVSFESLQSKSILKKDYDFVYLACGCINTTAIVDISTMGKGKRKYKIKSCPGLLGLHINLDIINILKEIKLKNSKKEEYELCNYFLEQKSILTSNFWSHTQIGVINKLIFEHLETKLHKFIFLIFLLMKDFLRFTTTVFHSSLGTDSILISEVNNLNSNYQRINIEEKIHQINIKTRISIAFAIISKFKTLKLLPIPFMDIVGSYFRNNRLGGWHYGGTLPIKKNPRKKTQCFPNGRLKGIKNTYIVDSSAFPSIPGSTVALLTMANAYHIARKSI